LFAGDIGWQIHSGFRECKATEAIQRKKKALISLLESTISISASPLRFVYSSFPAFLIIGVWSRSICLAVRFGDQRSIHFHNDRDVVSVLQIHHLSIPIYLSRVKRFCELSHSCNLFCVGTERKQRRACIRLLNRWISEVCTLHSRHSSTETGTYPIWKKVLLASNTPFMRTGSLCRCQICALFLETADNERENAKWFFKLMKSNETLRIFGRRQIEGWKSIRYFICDGFGLLERIDWRRLPTFSVQSQ
jgi:hypothetical protein